MELNTFDCRSCPGEEAESPECAACQQIGCFACVDETGECVPCE